MSDSRMNEQDDVYLEPNEKYSILRASSNSSFNSETEIKEVEDSEIKLEIRFISDLKGIKLIDEKILFLRNKESNLVKGVRDSVRVYQGKSEVPEDGINPISKYEPHIIALNYLRGAKLYLNYAKKTEFENELEKLWDKLVFDLSNSNDPVNHSELVVTFQTDICKHLEISSEELLIARECALLLVKPESVETQSDLGNGYRLSQTTQPNSIPKETIEKALNNFQNQSWFQSVNKKISLSDTGENWLENFFANSENQKKIIENARTVSPSARYMPWAANSKSETTTIQDEKEGVEVSLHRSRLGIAVPFDIEDRAQRIEATKQNILDVLRMELPGRIQNFMEKYAVLYEDKPVIHFPVVYQSLLSPLFLDDLHNAKDNNGRFLHELNEAIGQIKEDQLKDIIKDIPGSDRIKLTLSNINNPVNKLKAISVTRNQDIEDSQEIINSAADEFLLLAELFRKKNYAREILSLHTYANYLKSDDASFTGKIFGQTYFENIPEETLREIANIQKKLVNGEYSAIGLEKSAQVSLGIKLASAYQLRQLNHESYSGRYYRKFKSLPIVRNVAPITTDLVQHVLSPYSAYQTIKNTVEGTQPTLEKSALEHLTLGEKGLLISGCKSARDRKGVQQAATDAMLVDAHHKIKHSDPEKGPVPLLSGKALKEGIKKQLNTGHAWHSMIDHVGVVKLGDVGKALSRILDKTGKKVTKLLKKTMKVIKPKKSNDEKQIQTEQPVVMLSPIDEREQGRRSSSSGSIFRALSDGKIVSSVEDDVFDAADIPETRHFRKNDMPETPILSEEAFERQSLLNH